MATLQVKEMSDSLYEWLHNFSKANNRSISQQVITILQEKATNVQFQSQNAVDSFLTLSGTWEDTRSAEEIASDIISSRNNSSRFGESNELFN